MQAAYAIDKELVSYDIAIHQKVGSDHQVDVICSG